MTTSIIGRIATGELPPTKSHKRRRWMWCPNLDKTLPSMGTFTIIQGTKDADSYTIATVDGAVCFAKQDADADVYAVNKHSGIVRCNCRGFGRAKTCKHCDAVAVMVAESIVCEV